MSDEELLRLAYQLLDTITHWYNAFGESAEVDGDTKRFLAEANKRGLGSWDSPDYYHNCWEWNGQEKTITYVTDGKDSDNERDGTHSASTGSTAQSSQEADESSQTKGAEG